MDRGEAIKVLFEINDGCKSLPYCVNLERPSSHIIETPSGIQIRLKGHINQNSRKSIKSILEKHKLKMRKEEGCVVFYSSDSKCTQAQATKIT
jgi:hypothetical protein